jgi:hypothetical protein
MNIKTAAVVMAASICLASRASEISEISVDLALDETSYIVGERIRGVIDVKNMSADTITVDGQKLPDRLFVEVFRMPGRMQLERMRKTAPFVSPFRVGESQGQKLETIISDIYNLRDEGRYLARPVLVHNRTRYEGQFRAFDVVPGVKVTGALQMFANHSGLKREFSLVRWTRDGREHLFLTARDTGTSSRAWQAKDIGVFMKMTPPIISILPSGEVIVVHRVGPDNFLRSTFWSLPGVLEFRGGELLEDPESAGQARVQEMYRKAGGVKAAPRPWWKFW